MTQRSFNLSNPYLFKRLFRFKYLFVYRSWIYTFTFLFVSTLTIFTFRTSFILNILFIRLYRFVRYRYPINRNFSFTFILWFRSYSNWFYWLEYAVPLDITQSWLRHSVSGLCFWDKCWYCWYVRSNFFKLFFIVLHF